MKKLISISIMLVSLLVLGMGSANATLFTDTIDFDNLALGELVSTPVPAVLPVIAGGGELGLTTYSHKLPLDLPGSIVNAATLSITHRLNSNDASSDLWNAWNPEVWFVYGETGVRLGKLTYSGLFCETTNTFNVSTLLGNSSIISDGRLAITLSDTTRGADLLFLERSKLAVDYTAPAPEPGSLFLLGSGLMGMLGFGYRKMRA